MLSDSDDIGSLAQCTVGARPPAHRPEVFKHMILLLCTRLLRGPESCINQLVPFLPILSADRHLRSVSCLSPYQLPNRSPYTIPSSLISLPMPMLHNAHDARPRLTPKSMPSYRIGVPASDSNSPEPSPERGRASSCVGGCGL